MVAVRFAALACQPQIRRRASPDLRGEIAALRQQARAFAAIKGFRGQFGLEEDQRSRSSRRFASKAQCVDALARSRGGLSL